MMQGINRPVLQGMIKILEQQLRQAQAIDTGCRSCEKGGPDFKCQLAGGQTVPPEHRGGCDSWTWDEIPFDRRAAAPAPKPQHQPTVFRRKPGKPGDLADWEDNIPF